MVFGLMSRVFANGQEDRVSFQARVILKTQKMLLNSTLLKTQHHKLSLKGKVEQSRVGVAPYLHHDVVAIEKGAFESPSTKGATFTYFFYRKRDLMHTRESFNKGWFFYKQVEYLFKIFSINVIFVFLAMGS